MVHVNIMLYAMFQDVQMNPEKMIHLIGTGLEYNHFIVWVKFYNAELFL